jgi:hypothetical protein
MEQTTTTTTTTTSGKPEGKGLGVAGFVISLIAVVLFWVISPIALFQAVLGGGWGLSGFWLVFSLFGTILSFLGMSKLGKTGGKKGLALTGMILGIVAVLLSIWLLYGISQAHAAIGDQVNDAIKEGFQGLGDSLSNDVKNAMEQAMDSLEQHQ